MSNNNKEKMNKKIFIAFVIDYVKVCLLKLKLNRLVHMSVNKQVSFDKSIIKLNKQVNMAMIKLDDYEKCYC